MAAPAAGLFQCVQCFGSLNQKTTCHTAATETRLISQDNEEPSRPVPCGRSVRPVHNIFDTFRNAKILTPKD